MHYCMKNLEAYIKSFAHGTTTKTITEDKSKNIDLLIHTNIKEQNRIERLLTSIDRKTENNNHINDNAITLSATPSLYFSLGHTFVWVFEYN